MGAMVALLTRSWLARLTGRHSAAGSPGVAADAADRDPLLAVGDTLRQAREQRGLNLRQLAIETRISTPVLEALERGWRDRLPETAYLRTMLPLLERHLQLERGSLRGALPEAQPRGTRREKATSRIPLLSVELFTTWQGTALYALLMLGLLYGLNLEQRRLAAQGYLALAPLPPMSQAARQQLPTQGEDLLLRVHPELRPLLLAARGRGLGLLRQPASQAAAPPESGLLVLTLSRSSRLQLEGAGGLRTQLQAGPGELALPLTTPLQLSLVPPPAAADAVQWNGLPLPAAPKGSAPELRPAAAGRWPRPARAASSP